LACFGNSWQSLGALTKILTAEWRDTTLAGTVKHGVRGLVYGCLPGKEPGVFAFGKGLSSFPPKEEFVFPPKGLGIPNLEWCFPFFDLGVLG